MILYGRAHLEFQKLNMKWYSDLIFGDRIDTQESIQGNKESISETNQVHI